MLGGLPAQRDAQMKQNIFLKSHKPSNQSQREDQGWVRVLFFFWKLYIKI